MIDKELSSKLRELRIKSGLSINHVAEKMKCPKQNISSFETGIKGISLSKLRKILELYGYNYEIVLKKTNS